MTLARPSVRIFSYTLLAIAMAAATMFTDLGADRMWGDEAIYARCVDNMIKTGDWLSPAPFPGAEYFQKPPLQMWLNATTYHLFPDVVRYRFWSALFGVLTAGLICALAGRLLLPEVGLIAGLLIATHNRFLFEHGARAGEFDTALTFFTLLGVTIYAVIERGRWVRTGWVILGVTIGLAGLLKPLAGLPLLALLAIHAFTLPRARWRAHFTGLAIALGVSLLVIAPWYVAQTVRFGMKYPQDVFINNIVKRSAAGLDPRHVKSPGFYAQVIPDSAAAFILVWPAAVFAVAASLRGPERAAWRLFAIVGIGWVVLFSISRSKTMHYAYPALPALAVCIGGLVGWLAATLARVWRQAEYRERTVVCSYVSVAIVLLMQGSYLISQASRSARKFEPFEIYRSLEPAIRSGAVRFIIAGFEEPQPLLTGGRGLEPHDLFYLERMPGYQQMKIDEAHAALTDRRPTLLLFSRSGKRLNEDLLTHRTDERFSLDSLPYSMRGVDLAPIFSPPIICEQPAFDGQLTLTTTPAVSAHGSLELRFRLDQRPAGQILCTVRVGNEVLVRSTAFAHDTEGLFTTIILSKYLKPGRPVRLELYLQPISGDQPVRGTFESARITQRPSTKR